MIITSELCTIFISSYVVFLILLCAKSTYELLIHDHSNDIVNIKFKNIYNYFNTIDYTNCIICFEKYKSKSDITLLPCKHYYHSDCLYDWITTSQSYNCPYCQKQYNFEYDYNYLYSLFIHHRPKLFIYILINPFSVLHIFFIKYIRCNLLVPSKPMHPSN